MQIQALLKTVESSITKFVMRKKSNYKKSCAY